MTLTVDGHHDLPSSPWPCLLDPPCRGVEAADHQPLCQNAPPAWYGARMALACLSLWTLPEVSSSHGENSHLAMMCIQCSSHCRRGADNGGGDGAGGGGGGQGLHQRHPAAQPGGHHHQPELLAAGAGHSALAKVLSFVYVAINAPACVIAHRSPQSCCQHAPLDPSRVKLMPKHARLETVPLSFLSSRKASRIIAGAVDRREAVPGAGAEPLPQRARRRAGAVRAQVPPRRSGRRPDPRRALRGALLPRRPMPWTSQTVPLQKSYP